MPLLMDLAALFAGLNMALLLTLIYVYSRITLRSRGPFALGLLIFSVFLLAQNAMTLFSFIEMEPFFGEPVLPFLVGISALEFAGLLAYLRVTI